MSAGELERQAPLPGGAMIAVVSRSPDGPRYLLLHNAEFAPGEEGDWAWGPPSGCLEPDEDIEACAARELFEETGIRAKPEPVCTDGIRWALFFLKVPWGTDVSLDSAEHNAFAWVTFKDAMRLHRPTVAADGFRVAVEAALRAGVIDAR